MEIEVQLTERRYERNKLKMLLVAPLVVIPIATFYSWSIDTHQRADYTYCQRLLTPIAEGSNLRSELENKVIGPNTHNTCGEIIQHYQPQTNIP